MSPLGDQPEYRVALGRIRSSTALTMLTTRGWNRQDAGDFLALATHQRTRMVREERRR